MEPILGKDSVYPIKVIYLDYPEPEIVIHGKMKAFIQETYLG